MDGMGVLHAYMLGWRERHEKRKNALIRHPCMSDKATQYRLPLRTVVVCFSVTVGGKIRVERA